MVSEGLGVEDLVVLEVRYGLADAVGLDRPEAGFVGGFVLVCQRGNVNQKSAVGEV